MSAIGSIIKMTDTNKMSKMFAVGSIVIPIARAACSGSRVILELASFLPELHSECL